MTILDGITECAAGRHDPTRPTCYLFPRDEQGRTLDELIDLYPDHGPDAGTGPFTRKEEWRRDR